MSKIAIDARELSTSTGRYVERLLYYLQKIDRDNSYLVLLKPRDFNSWQPSNSNFTKVACPHKEFTFDEQLGFKRQLDSLSADLVHFTMTQQPVRYQGKALTTIHDLTTLRFANPSKNTLVFKFKQRVYGYVIKRVARKSEALITGSQYVKDDVVSYTGIDSSKIAVTHEAADPIKDPALPLAELVGKQFIVYVGRPTPHKNLERLIESFVRLQIQYPDLLLVLAGKEDDNYRRLQDRSRRRGFSGIIFPGFVSEGQLRWLYENCAAYVFPSLSEGFGLPGLEAMAHGAPVISSSATCLPEIYGDAAHYFDPTNVSSMTDAVNDVLTDKKLRSDLIKKGRTQAAKYSWERMAKQTLSLYKDVLHVIPKSS